MIPFALAGGGQYRAVGASLHARTHADTISRFLGEVVGILERADRSVEFQFGSTELTAG